MIHKSIQYVKLISRKEFIILVEIFPLGIFATMYISKSILHYKKMKLYKLIRTIGLSVYSRLPPHYLIKFIYNEYFIIVKKSFCTSEKMIWSIMKLVMEI